MSINSDKLAAPFFWLHIKKSAGITTRKLLSPYYTEVDRIQRPGCFIQAEKRQYNDILNNFRVPLGAYQFRRALFAKEYLYPDVWDDIYSFAFVREPVDRCISMFEYLFFDRRRRMKYSFLNRRPILTRSSAFDMFLDNIEEVQNGNSIYFRGDLHFSTHTAPMWNDVTDESDNVLLTKIYRLEHLNQALNEVFDVCGIEKRLDVKDSVVVNRTERSGFRPCPRQIRRLESIFAKDFDLYEAGQSF